MVVPVITRRRSPAPHPSTFATFAEWVAASTKERGEKAHLARAANITAQAVQKWRGKDVPKPHVLMKVADWAGVEYQDLLRLVDRSRGGPSEAESERADTFEHHFGFTLGDWMGVDNQVRSLLETAIISAVQNSRHTPAPRGRRAPPASKSHL